MSHIIILEHDGGEMGNQLWNYASVYAYCVEKRFACDNWSFFEYARYFNLAPSSRFINLLFFFPFRTHDKRRSSLQVRLYRSLYKMFVVRLVSIFQKKHIVYSREGANTVYYLPPTAMATQKLAGLELASKRIFFSHTSGGVFRDPLGMQKYRASIEEHFRPAPWVDEKVSAFVRPLRVEYQTLVGVHIRQGDYAMFKGGKFVMSPDRVRGILDEYLKFSQKSSREVVFIIASDGSVDQKLFEGLNVMVSKGSAGEDLFVLASCDVIIGSDSTFGNFASYYGNIPHIIMKNDSMDWSYYADKNTYFINKYFTVMLN